MDWTEIKIKTNSAGIEPLTGALLGIGITGIQIENPEDFNAFLKETEPRWDYVEEDLMALGKGDTKVILYLPENVQGKEQFALLCQELEKLKKQGDFGELSLEMKGVKEEDWANNWKQYFKPFPVGEKLYIKPSWEKAGQTEGRKIIEIDPGSSFGTGTHETTRLCLECLERAVKPGDKVLDLGCGSGILSIGARLLGASFVQMVDIDQNAVGIAKENMAKNRIPEEVYRAVCGNILEDPSLAEDLGTGYDVVCANIVADVLIGMCPLFSGFLKESGLLVISGIITERKDEVVDAVVKQGFSVQESFEEGHWSCVLLKLDKKSC
jgi:ribosomal protein L11 methyltransferase